MRRDGERGEKEIHKEAGPSDGEKEGGSKGTMDIVSHKQTSRSQREKEIKSVQSKQRWRQSENTDEEAERWRRPRSTQAGPPGASWPRSASVRLTHSR